jgi:anti-sigma factor RsiW
MMTCEELLEYLSDYIDNNLSEELSAEARAHIATCHNCHVVLDTTRETITLFRKCGEECIPSERRTALFQRLQKALIEREHYRMSS